MNDYEAFELIKNKKNLFLLLELILPDKVNIEIQRECHSMTMSGEPVCCEYCIKITTPTLNNDECAKKLLELLKGCQSVWI